MSRIYLNAASHGLPSQASLERVRAHVDLECQIGPLAAAEQAEQEVEQVYGAAARFIGALVEDVALCATTTATLAGLLPGVVKAGQTVLVAPQEWGDNLRVLENLGAVVRVLPDLEAGDLAAEGWRAAITEDVAAIMVPLVSSITGARVPVEALSARPQGCRLIVDAAQALGQVKVDVGALGADVLVGTCRKWLRGPRTTALAWRAPAAEAVVPMAELRPNDGNVALQLGLGVALGEAGLSLALRDRAWAAAQEMGLGTWSGAAPETGALTLAIPNERVEAVRDALSTANILVKFPNPKRDEPYLSVGPANHVPMRIAAHVCNTDAEIDALIAALCCAL